MHLGGAAEAALAKAQAALEQERTRADDAERQLLNQVTFRPYIPQKYATQAMFILLTAAIVFGNRHELVYCYASSYQSQCVVQALEMDELQQDAAGAVRVAEEAAELRAAEVRFHPASCFSVIILSQTPYRAAWAPDGRGCSSVSWCRMGAQAAAQLRLAEAAREVEALRAKLAAASGAASSKVESFAEQHRELKQARGLLMYWVSHVCVA